MLTADTRHERRRGPRGGVRAGDRERANGQVIDVDAMTDEEDEAERLMRPWLQHGSERRPGRPRFRTHLQRRQAAASSVRYSNDRCLKTKAISRVASLMSLGPPLSAALIVASMA
jgi:hypothetical protein